MEINQKLIDRVYERGKEGRNKEVRED